MAYEHLARVHLLDALYHLDKAYDYRLTDDLVDKVQVGDFVLVPFGGGNRRQIGLVTEIVKEPPKPNGFVYKPVFDVLDEAIRFNAEMLRICAYMKEHTFCTIGDAAKTLLPPCAFSKWEERYERTEKALYPTMNERTLSLLRQVEEGVDTLSGLQTVFGGGVSKELAALVKDGYLRYTWLWKEQNRKYVRRFFLNVDRETLLSLLGGEQKLRSEKQIQALQLVAENAGLTEKELCGLGVSAYSLKSLLEKGYVSAEKAEQMRNPYAVEDACEQKPVRLNAEQKGAYERLCTLLHSGRAQAALLHGVTGSGKTQVIRAMMDEILKEGRQVILMVPEIALTPQTVRIFLSCYGKRTAVLHSGLSEGERLDAWRRIKRGEVDICIGTRSAVFAPFTRLGMIVLDEEQEHTYKSDSNPKFHARDIARLRCAHQGALLLLASATPSLESYYKAQQGIYNLVTLKQRYGGATLPDTQIIDLRTEAKSGRISPIGRVLEDAVSLTHEDGNQSILFLNRRGYHSFLSCPSCGEVVVCPHCSVSLTYHKGYLSQLRCHYCGYRREVPKTCHACGYEHLSFLGYGTQQAEEALGEALPELSVLRMDADTTVSKFSYEEMIDRFRNEKSDVLLGTQMVTKGHDFPKVTLVGVLNADQSLYLNDYRANERTFSLLTQVIGRAGRGDQHGRALIQTYQPDHPVLRLAAEQDYEAFYEKEIALRRATVFPPFCDLVSLTCSGKTEVEVMEVARHLLAYMKELIAGEYAAVKVVIYGPQEAPVYKMNDKYRLRFILKCKMNAATRKWMHLLLIRAGELTKKVSVSVDVNPNHS